MTLRATLIKLIEHRLSKGFIFGSFAGALVAAIGYVFISVLGPNGVIIMAIILVGGAIGAMIVSEQ